MKLLGILLALLITCTSNSFAQENAEKLMNEVVELRDQAKELSVLKKGWNSYKLGDHEAALNLWMPLAEAGNSSAQVFIGLLYNQGHAVKQDSKKAANWYELASNQGYAPAQWRLAILYYHGSGVTQNYQKAANLYHSAAKQEDVYSQGALAMMFSKGFGVPKDNVLAYSWFQLAGNNGFRLAQKYQNNLSVEMAPEEIAKAQAIAKRCVRSNYEICGWVLISTDDPVEVES